jgi:hypothetical protein
MRLIKELRPLADKYKAKGWTLSLTHGGHIRWLGPRGQVVISSSTPSDWRATKQLAARLKRAEQHREGR